VHIHLDTVDRILAEVMRGFGAVPKRGVEVGGVLIGSIEKGARTIVRIEDFEPVACEYKRGPSYLFVAGDREAFEDACRRWEPNPAQPTFAVGFFRSHTREGFSLGTEDIEIMDHYFPSPAGVALLIKPYATKVSVASFFAREKGVFPNSALLEFPFRRRELTGEDAPPRRTMLERVPRRREPRTDAPAAAVEEIAAPEQGYGYAAPKRPPRRPAWVWLPLSFVFLLLGVALGFQVGLTLGPRTSSSGADYSLGLSVTRDGDNLSVKWNRDAPAVKAADKGLLEIQDGAFAKPVDLDPAQLRNASILFTASSKSVRFRLTVYPSPGVTVVQVVEWRGQ
jgi:hypothetical protein